MASARKGNRHASAGLTSPHAACSSPASVRNYAPHLSPPDAHDPDTTTTTRAGHNFAMAASLAVASSAFSTLYRILAYAFLEVVRPHNILLNAFLILVFTGPPIPPKIRSSGPIRRLRRRVPLWRSRFFGSRRGQGGVRNHRRKVRDEWRCCHRRRGI